MAKLSCRAKPIPSVSKPTSSAGSSSDKVVTEGNFYGDGATEMGGIYGKNSTANPEVKEYIGAYGVRFRP